MSGIIPGAKYRWARRTVQAVVLMMLFGAPLLGGWQRLDRNNLSNWDGHGWDLPGWMLDMLPLGDVPAQVYQANQLIGGGASDSLLGLPAVDPVGGLVAVLAGSPSIKLLIAWALPLLLAFVAGRWFCGWLCPFGMIARTLDKLLECLPWRFKVAKLPERRPVRWVILAATVLLGFFGFQTVLYLLLPHVMTQMSGYAFWLMGGGGAAIGWLLGLLLAGVVFGPTTYCAAVCPTGAALSLPGHTRRISVYIEDLDKCGKKCTICTQSCWLQLDPAGGLPGADCDLCARCFPTCPTTNLRIGLTPKDQHIKPSHLVGLLLLALGSTALPISEAKAGPQVQPRLLLDQIIQEKDAELALSVVDMNGVQLDANDPFEEKGFELSFALTRGSIPKPDPRGKRPFRDTYRGPITVSIERGDKVIFKTDLAAPNYPRSTPRRRLYQMRAHIDLAPHDIISLHAIPEWTTGAKWQVPTPNPGTNQTAPWVALIAGFLLFSGLMAMAMAIPPHQKKETP